MFSPSSALNPMGRFNRLSYFAWNSTILSFVLLVLGYMLYWFSQPDLHIAFEDLDDLLYRAISLSVLPQLLIWILSSIWGIRRLHDLEQSGWLILIMLVPIANLGLSIYLLCFAGSPNNNRYGAYRATTTFEKILLLLHLCIVIGFLVFIAWYPPLSEI